MNEQEYLDSRDLEAMLEAVWSRSLSGPGSRRDAGCSDRKLRLLAINVSRILHPNGYWEGQRENDLAVYSYAEAWAELNVKPTSRPNPRGYCSGLAALLADRAIDAARLSIGFVFNPPVAPDLVEGVTGLMRDVFGNPWRPVTIKPEWATPQAASLAQAAYEEADDSGRLDNHRLGILADALEEAGCDNQNALSHLRSEVTIRYKGGSAIGSWARIRNVGSNVKEAIKACQKHFHNLPGVWADGQLNHYKGCHILDALLGRK